MKNLFVYVAIFLAFSLTSYISYAGFSYEAAQTPIIPTIQNRLQNTLNIQQAHIHANSTEVASAEAFSYQDILELIQKHNNVSIQVLSALSLDDRVLLFQQFTPQDYVFLINISQEHDNFVRTYLATIQHLRLDTATEFNLTEEQLLIASHYLPSLQHLTLNTLQASDRLIILLVHCFPGLISLDLTHANISLNTVNIIVNSLHNLRELRLEPNLHLTHEALQELLQYRMYYDSATKTWRKIDSKPVIVRTR